MNNRFTLQDLAGILATQTGRTKKDSEEFLREFISVVSDGAFTDRIVKVKGLGTFKIIEVGDRESVNVNTGQRFMIPGHYKFNFTPDKDLKELVNKPFSFFDTTEINTEDSLRELTATTGESIEAPEEVEENREEESRQLNTESEELTGEEVEKETSNIEFIEEKHEIPVEPETPEDLPLPPVPVNDESPQEEETKDKAVTVQQKKNKLLLIIIFVLMVISVGVFTYLLLNSAKRDQNLSSVPIESSIIEPLQNEQDIIEAPDVAVEGEEQSLTGAVSSGSNQDVSPDNSSSKVLTHITIEPGSRLTLLSLEYYQHKVFWVYIYEYNKKLIDDPNNIPLGTKLAIPAPEVYGINVNDSESIEKASLLQTQILAGEK